jgi:predicted lipoprotein with Yx(FWY)xxD motif
MHKRAAVALAGLLVVLAACSSSASPSGSPSGVPSTAPSEQPSAPASEPGDSNVSLTIAQTSAGDALAGENGLTLYINTGEADGTIVCVDSCAENWPPLVAPVDAGEATADLLGTVTRPDGTEQVTYNGFPLYYFVGDTTAGNAAGQGVSGVWFIADPAGN